MLAGVSGPAHLPPSDILSGYRRASGGHSGKNIDHERADRVHQRDRRNRLFSHGGHHQRICQPYANGQKLFQQQRNQEGCKLAVAKADRRAGQRRFFPP